MYVTAMLVGYFVLGQASAPLASSPPTLTPIPAATVPADVPATVEKTDAGAPARQPAPDRESSAGRALTPPLMVSESLTLPAASALTGRPLTLLAAVASTTDRRRQTEAAHAYWRLVEAVAQYRFCLDYDRQLESLGDCPDFRGTRRENGTVPLRPDERSPDAELQTARASSAALLREAEVGAVAAQYDMASLAMFAPETALPLPVDPPHVGPYETHFDQLFSRRLAPATIRLIDRTLPLRQQAIESRAAAVVAADDALSAALEGHRTGQVKLSAVLTCLRQHLRQRQTLIQTVCLYNQSIADYATAVASVAATPRELVGMMITVRGSAIEPLVSGDLPAESAHGADRTGVKATGFDEPIPAPAMPPTRQVPTPAVRPSANVPTPAVRPEKNVPTPAVRPPANVPTPAVPPEKNVPTPAVRPEKNVPTRAVRPGGVAPTPGGVPAEVQSSDWVPSSDAVPAPLPVPKTAPGAPSAEMPAGQDSASQPPALLDPGSQKRRLVPVQPSDESIPVEANKPIASGESPGGKPAEGVKAAGHEAAVPGGTAPAMYSGLAAADPAVRAKQLAAALHWDRSLPEGIGRPTTLQECLDAGASGDRRSLIAAYWQARQRAAEYQAVLTQADLIDDLVFAVSQQGQFPSARLHSAQATTRAAKDEALVALVEAQFELARRVGQAADGLWPIPSTIPHSGPYLLKLDAQPRGLAESWTFKRLAAIIPVLTESVREHAAAAVGADLARAKAGAAFAQDPQTVEEALAAVGEQTEQTLAFLQTLTDYNSAIAEYALAVLPADAPADALAAALVVQ